MKPLLLRRFNSFFNNHFTTIAGYGASIFPPDRYDIETTTHCNLTCDFCQVPLREPITRSMLSYEKFSEILTKIPYARYIKLQGMGEPFLNRQLINMIALCNEKKISVEINTNGTAITEKTMAELFRSPPRILSFSLDASTSQTFREMRGSDHFDEVCHAIQLAVHYKRVTKSSSSIRIWSLLSQKNREEIVPIIQVAGTLGVDEMVLQPKITGYGSQSLQTHNNNTHQVSETALEEYESELQNAADRLGLSFTIFGGNQYRETCHCPFLKNMPFITVTGEVVPCCVIANPDTVSMGNIFKSRSFATIWNGKNYRTFRQAVLKTNTRPGFCRSCYVVNE